ncbi:MAG: DUF362 domain-containing protein [Anaerolineaceae bacterium]|nr:DUF362 domain-containing protein [Anaerolineaceae bacterium]
MKMFSRRDFLRLTGYGLTAMAVQQILSSCRANPDAPVIQTLPTEALIPNEASLIENTQQPESTAPQDYPYMVVARGEQPEEMVRQGMKALGGMQRFMKPGANVIIKPNICVGYHTHEYAATTNPWVVAGLVKMCIEAGAGSVRVMDYPFGGPAEQAYRVSEIGDQVMAAGGSMEVMQGLKYVEKTIENAVSLNKVTVYQDVLDADLLINVPVAKHHSMAKLTLGLKNLMGTIRNRAQIHPSFENNLVDLAMLVKPQLTVIDGMRTLMANGPTGGNLDDVMIQNTLIFSPDIVAADSYATRLFNMTPADVPYILSAENRGLGKADLSGLKIEEINV